MNSTLRPTVRPQQVLEQSRQATLSALLRVDDSTLIKLTRLTLPEIREIQQEISRIFPAGNLPAFVLSGLLKLKGRRVELGQVRSDMSALLRGINLIPQGLYGIFFAGPAAALYAYQKLLQLAGKDPLAAFPEGTWQFYLQFGLREDYARHANETTRFHHTLPAHPDPVAMAAAWVSTAIEFIYSYDDLLAVGWEERVMMRLVLEEAWSAGKADQAPFVTLVRDWNDECPYHRPPDGTDYFTYRRAVFQRFLQERLRYISPEARERFGKRYRARRHSGLAAYQRQMTVLAFLQPDRYQEHKEYISVWQAHVAFVWQGHTFLLPLCRRDEQASLLCYPVQPEDALPIPLYGLSDDELCDSSRRPVTVDRAGWVRYQDGQLLGRLRPPEPQAVMGWVKAILDAPPDGAPPALDMALVESKRAAQSALREGLPQATQEELELLRRAPVIVNWDLRPGDLPLSYIRRDRRGIGDHPLTILRTESSVVFDQSHIFFDGVWGLAIAEIMADSAAHRYNQLAGQPSVKPVPQPQPLRLQGSPQAEMWPQPQRRIEVAAESVGVDTRRLFRLREWLRQRGVHLTVNDLLLLCRFFHATEYQPSPQVQRAIDDLCQHPSSDERRAACQAIEATLTRLRQTNPALLILMDASSSSPKERVFPATFRNPLVEIRDRFGVTLELYHAYNNDHTAKSQAAFDQARRELLAYLKVFGELLDALKAVTMRGESFNTATIRLLAHLPPTMRHLMDQIPQRIGILNEIIKGNEVFSNVGRVAAGTFLTRFISAKDDGETKELIWGVLTDDRGQMHISLRDFRPFVPHLVALGEAGLAEQLARDYLQSYVATFNRLVTELGEIITAD